MQPFVSVSFIFVAQPMIYLIYYVYKETSKLRNKTLAGVTTDLVQVPLIFATAIQIRKIVCFMTHGEEDLANK